MRMRKKKLQKEKMSKPSNNYWLAAMHYSISLNTRISNTLYLEYVSRPFLRHSSYFKLINSWCMGHLSRTICFHKQVLQEVWHMFRLIRFHQTGLTAKSDETEKLSKLVHALIGRDTTSVYSIFSIYGWKNFFDEPKIFLFCFKGSSKYTT